MTPERCKTRVVSFMINLAKFLERVPKPYCWAEGVKRSGWTSWIEEVKLRIPLYSSFYEACNNLKPNRDIWGKENYRPIHIIDIDPETLNKC